MATFTPSMTRCARALRRLPACRTHQQMRRASVLSHHRTPRPTASIAASPHSSTGRASMARPVRETPQYLFKYKGPAPAAPQAVDRMDFVLGRKPLDYLAPAKINTAADAKARAAEHLEDLSRAVENASGIMGALSKASHSLAAKRQQEMAAAPRVEGGKKKHAAADSNEVRRAALLVGSGGALAMLVSWGLESDKVKAGF